MLPHSPSSLALLMQVFEILFNEMHKILCYNMVVFIFDSQA
jgi:hypothetical protein